MRDNTRMLFMMQKLLPGSIPGVDYQVTTQYAEDGVTIAQDSQISFWNLEGLEQPSNEVIDSYWTNTYSALWDAHLVSLQEAEAARKAKVITDAII